MLHTLSGFAQAAFLETFLRFMAFSLKRGVPALEFVDRFRLTHSLPQPVLRDLAAVSRLLQSGNSLSTAMESAPGLFPSWLVTSIRAGEEGGQLELVMDRLGALQARRCRFLRAVEHDWSLPLLLLCTISLFFLGLGVLVLPELYQNYVHFMTNSIVAKLWAVGTLQRGISLIGWAGFRLLLLAALIGVVTAIYLALKTPFGDRIWNLFRRVGRRIPLYGPAHEALLMAGYCEFVAGLMAQGLPLHQTLTMGAAAVPEGPLRDSLLVIAHRVEVGDPLSTAGDGEVSLPRMFLLTLSLGMNEDTIVTSFNELAQHYREQAEATLDRARVLTQPLVTVFLGGMVALMWLCVFSILFGFLGVIEGA